MSDLPTLSRIIECLLFVAGEPLSVRELAKTTETDAEAIIESGRAAARAIRGVGSVCRGNRGRDIR